VCYSRFVDAETPANDYCSRWRVLVRNSLTKVAAGAQFALGEADFRRFKEWASYGLDPFVIVINNVRLRMQFAGQPLG